MKSRKISDRILCTQKNTANTMKARRSRPAGHKKAPHEEGLKVLLGVSTMVRNKRLTPGVFIDRVKQELFQHTQAEKINAIFELSIQQNGLLSDQPQRITLYLSLLRKKKAMQQE